MGGERELAQDWDSLWSEAKENFAKELGNIESLETYTLVAEVLSRLERGSPVLDAGSGLGKWVFYFSQKGYRSFGVDLSNEAVEFSRDFSQRSGLPATIVKGDLREIPFGSDSFSAVFSFGAIEHFEGTEKAVDEFYRITKKGGYCFMTTPNLFSFHGLIGNRVSKLTKNYKFGYVGMEKYFTPRQLGEMMAEAGFTVEKTGLVPTTFLFGVFYPAIPVVGRPLRRLLGRASFWIESHQSTVGFMSYALGVKR